MRMATEPHLGQARPFFHLNLWKIFSGASTNCLRVNWLKSFMRMLFECLNIRKNIDIDTDKSLKMKQLEGFFEGKFERLIKGWWGVGEGCFIVYLWYIYSMLRVRRG